MFRVFIAMGSGASALANEVPGADLRLPASGLRFSAQQVRSLNSYVDTLHEEDQNGKAQGNFRVEFGLLGPRVVMMITGRE